MAKIAVLGYGTVGSGVVEVLNTNGASIAKRAGDTIEVKSVLDLRDFPGDPIQDKIVHDIDLIINDPEIEVVVEVMGGVEPAFTFVKKALEAGKSVCTSNKALVAAHGPELLEMAKERRLNFMFEASVGGGIPIIRPLNQSLTADEITKITGILNGTTNYILTKMSREGISYQEVLKEAQALGYAERNPEADVEGYDACRKIAILSSLACGKQVDYEDIYTEGITKLTDLDFMYAKEMGLTIKLIGSAKKTGNRFSAMVSPKLISNEHPLAGVNGVMNAIFVKGNVLGDVMFYGAGAGKLPTASAVVSDVVDAVRHLGENVETKWSQEKLELIPHDEVCSNFFVRVKGSLDRLPEIEEKFGTVDTISITEGEFGFITGMMSEKAYADAAASTEGIISMIRYEK